MSENTDYEVFESEALEGRVYLQFLSGEIANQFKIECLGQMCHLKGRIRFVRRSRDVWSKFECTLEQAKMLSVCESDKAPPIPPSFTAVKCTVIRASDFPYHLPIENITMSLVNGDMCYESQQGAHNKKNMTLFKAEVTFRPLELITRPASMSGYSIEEVAFDKLTLFRGRLTIPRPFNLQVQVQVGTPPAVSARNNNNRNNHPLSPLHSTRSPVHGPRGLFAAPAPSLLRLPRALECFLFLLVVLCCLLFRSYHVTPETHNMYTMYTVVFVLSAALVIFSFRGLALQVLLRWASPQESNGRSFFVNGWNAWSFAGCVVQGAAPPVYSMPGMFVKAFHDGGVGTSLHINLGHGDAPLLPTVNNQGNGKVTWLPGWSHGSVLLKDETPLPLPLYKNTEPAIAARNPARDGIPVPQPILVGKPMCSEQVSPRRREASQSATEYTASAKDHVASDMFTLIADLRADCGVVLGFLSQRRQFGCIATNRAYDRVSVHVSGDGASVQGRTVDTDWLGIYTVHGLEAPFAAYMAISAEENGVSVKNATQVPSSPLMPSVLQTQGSSPILVPASAPLTPSFHPHQAHDKVPSGWCSWYHFYDRISEAVLLKNLSCMQRMIQNNHLAAVGFSLFQVDDGYQAAWGDWATVDRAKFPSLSLYSVVCGIKQANLVPGLWLAPFSCDKHSNVAKQHPEWILRSASGTASNSANCGKFFYGLDTTYPEVQEHIRASIDVARFVWGFEYLKLDFLYSAALVGAVHHDRTLTGAQIMQQAIGVVKEAAGGAYILGCGAPLGSLIGHVQANRVSADTGLSWVPEFPLPSADKWNLPCARNCVRNTLTRLFMHQQWWTNDPDCIMLRDKLAFTDDEIIGIATTKALSGGSFVVSDDLEMISLKRFRIALQLLPPARHSAVALDLMQREVPELFRQTLPSNYSVHAHDANSASAATSACEPLELPLSRQGSAGSAASTEDGAAVVDPWSPSRTPAPDSPGPPSPYSSRLNSKTLLSMQYCDSDQALSVWQTAPPSPEVSSLSRKRSKAGSDMVLRQEKQRLKERLRQENKLNEADLLGEHTLFTVCHWGEAPHKDHFVSVAQIFGAHFVAQLLEKKELLDSLIKLQAACRSSFTGSNSNRVQMQVDTARRTLASSPRYLMHMFNFWTQSYAHRVVTLQDCEVAFLGVPRHSAHIYSVSLTTDPTLPKYVGSNLHFTCGSELHRACMLARNPTLAEVTLKGAILEHLDEENGAYSTPITPREDDFAHDFGMPSTEPPSGSREGSAAFLPSPSRLLPVIRTMLLSFEAGALKNANFGGAVWVFLPVNGANKLMVSSSFSKVHVLGSAAAYVPRTFSATATASTCDSPFPHLHSVQHEYERLLPAPANSANIIGQRKGFGSDSSALRGDSSVQHVCRVSAADCKVHGHVYRIPVRCTSNSGVADVYWSSNSGAGAGWDHAQEHAGSGVQSEELAGLCAGRDHVAISWVYDLRGQE